MYDIIIAGGGTAGLSAALYGARAGKKVLVLEQKSYGGQILNSPRVENYPGIPDISGAEFARGLYEQAKCQGAELALGRVTAIRDHGDCKTVVTAEKEYETRTVILATGVVNRPLGLDQEEKLTGAGVSYCAACDGMFFSGRETAVAGGGNTALEDALFLSGICSKVYLIHRRDTFRGEEKLIEKLRRKENVECMMDSVVTELSGKDRLEEIQIQNVQTGEKTELSIAGLFIAIGQIPANDAFSEIVPIDKMGYIQAAEDCQTKTAGIFAAGDCRTKEVRQLTTAASDGAVAALAACAYMR